MSMSIEIGTFHWPTGHRRKFATKSGGGKIFNRLTQGRFRSSGVARGGFGGFNPPIVKKCVFFTA